MELLSIPEQVTALFTDLSTFARLAAGLTMENGIYTQNHIIDIISHCPPSITILPHK